LIMTPQQGHIAVVGAGPAGCFVTAEFLKKMPHGRVDILERLPTPFGLLRFGVAPDHGHTRRVEEVFTKIINDERVSFYGGVEVGRDLPWTALREAYHAVVVCTGAEQPRRLPVPGLELPGVLSSIEWTGWLNGHPDAAGVQPDLSGNTAALAGHGNVALDIARLLATPPERLGDTDMVAPALDAMKRSRIQTIVVLGRRGPEHASFSPDMLHELTKLPGVHVDVSPSDLDEAEQRLKAERQEAANARLIQAWRALVDHQPSKATRTISFKFFTNVIQISRNSSLLEVRARDRAGDHAIAASLFIPAIGYEMRKNACPEIWRDAGRVAHVGGRVDPGWYVCGWVKRGAKGLIGHNKADAAETVQRLIEDWELLARRNAEGIQAWLPFVREPDMLVNKAEWERIYQEERVRGVAAGKRAERYWTYDQFYEVAKQKPDVTA
jgi:ferredoxin/flavodoxin---NADP+ reductase